MTTPPTDPLFRYQWFLSNTGQSGGAIGSDINVLPVWTNYTGKGVRVGIVDDGVQLDQPDLKANIDLAGSWNAVANAPGGGAFGDNNHGTAVAGLVGEVANNGIGGSGVAPDATLQAYLINLGGKGPTQAFIAFQKALENKADVVNNSWGASAAFAANAKDPDQAAEFAALDALGSQGRGGKGSVVLFANGNDGAKGYDGNLDNLLNSRHVIAVGAIDDASVVTSYSTPGANLLISAPAGASTPQAEDRPGNGVLTTDRTGSDGYNKLAGVSGDYAYNFNGTSAATPVASGVVALMLQANPNLGYRDVQEILAHSARFVDTGGTSWTLTHPGSTPWNGGGEMFSRDYGFGEVDAHGAVRLAEVYPYLHSAPRSDANVVQTTASIPVNTEIDSDPAPGEDDDFPGLSNQVAFGVALPAGVDLNHLDLNLTAQVDHPSALTVTLTSPSGTTVVMINQPANAGSAWPQGGFSMGTDAFWGEQSGGNWLVRVAIGGEKEVGTVQSATLTGYGDATSTQKEFVYTDSFATVVLTDSQHPGGAAPRNLIEVRTGETAVIDAAAMSSDVTVNLDPGVRLARIAGQSINIDPATKVTKVFTGDGNDNLVGDAGDNAFLAGRGSNLIDGGAGVDTALYVWQPGRLHRQLQCQRCLHRQFAAASLVGHGHPHREGGVLGRHDVRSGGDGYGPRHCRALQRASVPRD